MDGERDRGAVTRSLNDAAGMARGHLAIEHGETMGYDHPIADFKSDGEKRNDENDQARDNRLPHF